MLSGLDQEWDRAGPVKKQCIPEIESEMEMLEGYELLLFRFHMHR